MRPLGAGILGHPRLEPRDPEILILRTCARAGAEYEWGVHAEAFGGPLGLTDQQIAATAAGQADDPAWAAAEAHLVAAADALTTRSPTSYGNRLPRGSAMISSSSW